MVVVGKRLEVCPHLLNVKVMPSVVDILVIPQRFPHGRIALESRSKAKLPDTISLLDTSNALHIGEDVPNGRARRVAESEESGSAWLCSFVPELEDRSEGLGTVQNFVEGSSCNHLELLLNLVDHCTPPRVDADVLKGCLEVGDVGLDLALEYLAEEEVEAKDELLRYWQHQRA